MTLLNPEPVVVIPSGTGKYLPPEIIQENDIVEIQWPCTSLMNELVKLPWDRQIVPLYPGKTEAGKVLNWKKDVEDCVTALRVSHISNDRLKFLRMHNALENRDQFLAGETVFDLPKSGEDTAFIVGAGGSLKDFATQRPDGGVVFACWRAVGLLGGLDIDYVGHCDPRVPEGATQTDRKQALIATPCVPPDFASGDNALYAYYDKASVYDSWFLKKIGAQPAPAINGTVTHMLTMAALIAGYKRIVMVGCELSYTSRKECERAHPGVKPERFNNLHGDVIWSPPNYANCRFGFDSLASEHPDVEFINYSSRGIPFKGFKQWDINA